MNELQTVGFDISLIHKSKTIEEALDVIKKVDALKTALEAVDEFHNKSVMYAQLEAEAILKVVELGGMKKLTGYKKKIAEWFVKLSSEEQCKIINECSDGVTLDYLYKTKVREPEKRDEMLKVAKWLEKRIFDDFSKSGQTDLSTYDHWDNGLKYLDRQTFADIKDGTRNRIRKLGGVGIGDGIYIRPNCGRTEEIKKAIAIRIMSITRDVMRLQSLCATASIQLKRDDYFEYLDDVPEDEGYDLNYYLMVINTIEKLANIRKSNIVQNYKIQSIKEGSGVNELI